MAMRKLVLTVILFWPSFVTLLVGAAIIFLGDHRSKTPGTIATAVVVTGLLGVQAAWNRYFKTTKIGRLMEVGGFQNQSPVR